MGDVRVADSQMVAPLVPAGHYMMINTGANYLPTGQAGYLVSPFRAGSTKTECVSFWYHTGGMNPGETPRLPARHTLKHTLISINSYPSIYLWSQKMNYYYYY